LAMGGNVFISQHIGDLETEAANNAFRRACVDLPRLYDAAPEIIAADLHPDYLSTKFARESGKEIVGVQHHIAHVLSCIAENEIQLPALGVAWDGTGYGLDGTIWGGEFFLVTEESTARVASLRPFRLPGGDAAVKEPRRSALGLLHELQNGGDSFMSQMRHGIVTSFSEPELAVLTAMLARGVNSPPCSSVGRLFDGVAALAGLRQRTHFEGQAAMELEFALEGIETEEAYSFAIAGCQLPTGSDASRLTPHSSLDWHRMIGELLADIDQKMPIGKISAKFHNALAEAIVAVAKIAGHERVALSGGCFQNRYLTERIVTRLRAENFQPFWHQRVATNDGGIALGQIFAARNNLTMK